MEVYVCDFDSMTMLRVSFFFWVIMYFKTYKVGEGKVYLKSQDTTCYLKVVGGLFSKKENNNNKIKKVSVG